MQLVCKSTGIEYPAMIFNTSLSPSAVASAARFPGDFQSLTGIIKISSVSVEPSIFAQVLLVGLSLCLPFAFGTYTLFSRKTDRRIFWLLLLALSITTSSTAYVGLLIIALTVYFLLIRRGMLKLRYVTVPLAGLIIAALVYKTVPVVHRVLNLALFEKAQSYSSFERLMTIHNAYQAFQEHPLLGLGWASITSHDLIVYILANSGIIGLSTFTIAMYFMFRALYRSINSRDKSLGLTSLLQMDFSLYVALTVTLFTSITSGFLNVFPFFWFTCGLAIASANNFNFADANEIRSYTGMVTQRI